MGGSVALCCVASAYCRHGFLSRPGSGGVESSHSIVEAVKFLA